MTLEDDSRDNQQERCMVSAGGTEPHEFHDCHEHEPEFKDCEEGQHEPTQDAAVKKGDQAQQQSVSSETNAKASAPTTSSATPPPAATEATSQPSASRSETCPTATQGAPKESQSQRRKTLGDLHDTEITVHNTFVHIKPDLPLPQRTITAPATVPESEGVSQMCPESGPAHDDGSPGPEAESPTVPDAESKLPPRRSEPSGDPDIADVSHAGCDSSEAHSDDSRSELLHPKSPTALPVENQGPEAGFILLSRTTSEPIKPSMDEPLRIEPSKLVSFGQRGRPQLLKANTIGVIGEAPMGRPSLRVPTTGTQIEEPTSLDSEGPARRPGLSTPRTYDELESPGPVEATSQTVAQAERPGLQKLKTYDGFEEPAPLHTPGAHPQVMPEATLQREAQRQRPGLQKLKTYDGFEEPAPLHTPGAHPQVMPEATLQHEAQRQRPGLQKLGTYDGFEEPAPLHTPSASSPAAIRRLSTIESVPCTPAGNGDVGEMFALFPATCPPAGQAPSFPPSEPPPLPTRLELPELPENRPRGLYKDCKDPTSGHVEVSWIVDAKKLESLDKQCVSTSFSVNFSGKEAEFQLIMYAKEVNLGRRGAGFRKAKGQGRLMLKCSSESLAEDFPKVQFSFSVRQDRRGPVEHKFQQERVWGLLKSKWDEWWNFLEAVDKQGNSVTIVADVRPAVDATAQDGSGSRAPGAISSAGT